ncbi:hypothetical protein [Streptomyces sp. NPDC048516]|uniref:hypothetical protein n=1 Tax=Streptomyces sp. NPDC048516 TaxID=3365565 RepID=UPI00371B74E4
MARLTSVPAPAKADRPKRSYAERISAIYEDPRVGHEARELLLAVSYGIQQAAESGVNPLKTARRVLGRDSAGQLRYRLLVKADAPRYEPPREAGNWGPSGAPTCEAPRLRPYKPRGYIPHNKPDPTLPEPTPIRQPVIPPDIAAFVAAFQAQGGVTHRPPRDWRTEDGVCGAQSHHRVLEKDPRTGWTIPHWFCKRHKGHADRVAAQVREQNEQAPEPIPNRGGLLGCYFQADWETVYRHYLPGWTVPSYGLCADDWPAPESAVKRGRLRVLVSSVDTGGGM